jgi:AcrR family transcriptional regulator
MLSTLDPSDPRASVAPLRNEPVQARSTARLAALLDAAAGAVDELGYERLTTAMVAERAGASIGTVYRYFPDRLAVLQALGARNLDRVLADAVLAVRDTQHSDWSAAVAAGFDVITNAFRDEPSFRSIRVGDVLDVKPRAFTHTYNSIVSENIFDALSERFELPSTPEARSAFEMAVEVHDGLVSRAFIFDPQGDSAIVVTAMDHVFFALAPHFGSPVS